VSEYGVKPLIIVGAGGLGREVAWLVEDINRNTPQWDLLGFVDDGVSGSTVEGYPVLGNVDSLFYMEPLPWAVWLLPTQMFVRGLYLKFGTGIYRWPFSFIRLFRVQDL
jgi:hypothetical protein